MLICILEADPGALSLLGLAPIENLIRDRTQAKTLPYYPVLCLSTYSSYDATSRLLTNAVSALSLSPISRLCLVDHNSILVGIFI